MNIFYKLDAMKILFRVLIFIFIVYGLYVFYYILKSIIFFIENFFTVVYTYLIYQII